MSVDETLLCSFQVRSLSPFSPQGKLSSSLAHALPALARRSSSRPRRRRRSRTAARVRAGRSRRRARPRAARSRARARPRPRLDLSIYLALFALSLLSPFSRHDHDLGRRAVPLLPLLSPFPPPPRPSLAPRLPMALVYALRCQGVLLRGRDGRVGRRSTTFPSRSVPLLLPLSVPASPPPLVSCPTPFYRPSCSPSLARYPPFPPTLLAFAFSLAPLPSSFYPLPSLRRPKVPPVSGVFLPRASLDVLLAREPKRGRGTRRA